MHFDASGTSCAATPCTYSWSDLPPSGGIYPLGSGTALDFTFQVVGTKYVTLTVTDSAGRTSSVEHNVAVSTPQTQMLAPVNTAPPSISGTARQGQVLSTSNGSWINGATDVGYAWQDCNSSGSSCNTISGAASASYTLTAADVGHTVRSVVTASNAAGSASATSSATGVVAAASQQAPVNTAAPSISGAAQQGQRLTTSNGSWSNSPTDFGYAWQDCNSSGGSCNTISGAASASYTLTAADVGHTVRSVVTASNAGGSASASSSVTAVVTAAAPPPPPPGSCDLNATPSSFASQVAAASSGQTVCLANGSYGTWTGTSKAITVTAANGASPTMKVSFGSGDSGFTLDGMGGMGGTINSGAANITIQNSTFSSQLDIEGATTNVVIDNNDFTYAVQSSTSGPNSKIFLDTSGSSPGSAVTIEHNDIENGDLDGIHIGGGSGDLILANRFQNLCDRGVNHTDNLQFEGGSQITIQGNYVYEAQNCPTQGITSYDGGTKGVVIEDNVVDVPRDWGIELYSDSGSIVRHNTVVWHPASYSEFNTGTGDIDIDRKTQDPAGTGTHVYDNVATVSMANGSTGTADHNTNPSTVSYVGGAPGPNSVYSDLFLAPGSPGVGAASDGLDTGIRHSVS